MGKRETVVALSDLGLQAVFPGGLSMDQAAAVMDRVRAGRTPADVFAALVAMGEITGEGVLIEPVHVKVPVSREAARSMAGGHQVRRRW